MQTFSVLTVDDNENILQIMEEVLKGLEELRVAKANSGAEGIRLALELKPDLILCDVMMPDVDGVELLRKLKEAKLRTRLIFVTGAATSLRDTVKLVKLGACDVLHKPLDNAELFASIRRALALESTLSLYQNEPSAVLKQAILETDYLRRENVELHSKLREISRRRTFEMVAMRLLYFDR